MIAEVLSLYFSQCVLPLLLSTWPVYMHATTDSSSIIGQNYLDYKRKPERFRYQVLLLAYRFCIHMQVSVYTDYISTTLSLARLCFVQLSERDVWGLLFWTPPKGEVRAENTVSATLIIQVINHWQRKTLHDMLQALSKTSSITLSSLGCLMQYGT